MNFRILQVAAVLLAATVLVLSGGMFSSVIAQQGLQVFTGQDSASGGVKTKKSKVRKTRLSANLQSELNRLDCKAGKIDGQWGRGSQRALDRLVEKQPDLKGAKKNNALLARLKLLPAGICALTCAPNQKIENGICVAIACENGEKLEDNGTCSSTFSSQINSALNEVNNITGLVNVGRFDGRWLIETTPSKRCATQASSYYVDIVKSRISGTTETGKLRTGRVTPSGRLELKGKPDAGKGNTITLTAKIKSTSGKGKLRLDGGSLCRGKFVMTKQSG